MKLNELERQKWGRPWVHGLCSDPLQAAVMDSAVLTEKGSLTSSTPTRSWCRRVEQRDIVHKMFRNTKYWYQMYNQQNKRADYCSEDFTGTQQQWPESPEETLVGMRVWYCMRCKLYQRCNIPPPPPPPKKKRRRKEYHPVLTPFIDSTRVCWFCTSVFVLILCQINQVYIFRVHASLPHSTYSMKRNSRWIQFDNWIFALSHLWRAYAIWRRVTADGIDILHGWLKLFQHHQLQTLYSNTDAYRLVLFSAYVEDIFALLKGTNVLSSIVKHQTA